MATKWIKAYKGPFQIKEEAIQIVKELKEKADPEKNGIYDAKIRKRRKKKNMCVCTAACGAGLGHNYKFDIYIKTDK